MSDLHISIKEVVEQGALIDNVSKTYLLAKRVLDIALSLLAIALLSPVMLLIALWIKISSLGAVFHRSEMCGLRGIRFKTYEFGPIVKGHYIRRLPLLFNVLKGDMSIVGPQPTPLCELEKYDAWHYLRMSAKPGITGLWQIKGKCGGVGGIDEMVRVDLKYIRERSFLYDMRIMLTAMYLLFKEMKNTGKSKTV